MSEGLRSGGRGRGNGRGGGNGSRPGPGGFYQGHQGRGGGGGGNGNRDREPSGAPPKEPAKVEHVLEKSFPDPYKQKYTQKQLKCQELGWKPEFSNFQNKENVVLHKRADGGKAAVWEKKRVNVSVNHYLVESRRNEINHFPIPTLYHYQIKFDREPKKNGPKQATATTSQDKPQVLSFGRGKRIKVERDPIGDMSIQLHSARLGKDGDDANKIVSRSQGPEKKWPKFLTNAILIHLTKQLNAEHGNRSNIAIGTDGSANMYTTRKLEDIPIPFIHHVRFEDLRIAGLLDDGDQGFITVELEPAMDKMGNVHTIDVAPLLDYFKENGTFRGMLTISPDLRQSLEAGCNAFVRNLPNFNYVSVGRSTMVPCDEKLTVTKPLGGGIKAWKGISANIAMGWKPYLNIDIANCAFVLDKPVLDVLKDVFGRYGNPSDISAWTERNFEEARGILNTCKVTYVAGGKKFSGGIRNVVENLTPTTHNFIWNGERINVYDYYRRHHNVKLKHPNGPLLEVRKPECYVPAEICVIKKGQSYNRKLDGAQTTQMLGFAKRAPGDLKKDIQKRMDDMKLEENQVLRALECKISNTMLQVDARVAVPPTLRYGTVHNDSSKVALVSPNDGTWDISREKFNFHTSVKISKWGILTVGCGPQMISGPKDKALEKFCQDLMRQGGSKGVFFAGPPIVRVDQVNRRNVMPLQNVADFNKYFMGAEHFKGCELVVVVIPKKGDPLYNCIKNSAETDAGMLTQCVVHNNVISSKPATVQQILLKINQEMGGINYVTVSPRNPAFTNQFCSVIMDCPVLIMGADVTHPPPGSKKVVNGREYIMPSFAAVCGSIDNTAMRYLTEMRAQRKLGAGAAEVLQDLEQITVINIQEYRNNSGVLPRKIIYLRDGVGEGQFKEVLHIEMKAIRRACQAFGDAYQPKITFITVQKRHKTRIFHDGKNAPAGTVIDSEIVHPTEIDFYLLSHFGALGTSRPSRYHVLWDDSDFSEDQLQSLVFTLCHMYARCTKAVKIPAPTYYAHLAAERAKKLCEGLETKFGEPTVENLNKILSRKMQRYPMHFI